MRWYGKIQELAQLIFRKSGFAVTVEPVSASADTVFQLPAAGGGTKSLTTADSATVFTNKTFDADASGNSISNIENADIKAGAAIDAAKIHDGSVSNTEFGHLNGVSSAILGKDDAGTFTNKTIAAGSNTITGLTKSDVGLGNVDNTSDATKNAAVATLTNKTIDGDVNNVQDLALTSLKTEAGDAGKVLARNGSGVVVSTDSPEAVLVEFNSQGSSPSTPAGAGDVRVFAKSDKLYTKNSLGIEAEVGAGVGGINYLSGQFNADALGTVDTSVGDTLASSTRTNPTRWGTSHSSNIITQSTDSTLRGTTNYLVSYSANAQFVESPLFTLDGSDLGKALLVSFSHSGVSTSDDVQAYMVRYNSSNVLQERIPLAGTASATTPFSARLNTGVSQLNSFFVSGSTASDKYALRILRNANATAVRLDSFVVGPQSIGVGFAGTDWVPNTGFTVNGFGTVTNTKFYTRRVGDSLQVIGYFEAGTAAATTASISLPAGLSIDNTKVAPSAANTYTLGPVFRLKAGSAFATGSILFLDGTSTDRFFFSDNGALAAKEYLKVNASGIDAGSDAWSFGPINIPISGWGSGIQIADRAVEEYAYNSSTSTTTSDTTSFAYGPAGAQIQNVTAELARTVQFNSPVQPTDSIILEVSPDRIIWRPVHGVVFLSGNNVFPYTVQNGVSYGIGAYGTGTNQVTVKIGTYCQNGSTYGAAGSAWSTGPGSAYWRVRKISGGAMVGYPVAQSNIVTINSTGEYSANTAAGKMVYTHSGSYNGGGAPTITSGESGFTVNGSEFIPYQMSDGSWRCKFNIQMSMDSATRTSITFVPNGVIGANTFEQAFYGWNRSASSSTQLCRVNQNTSNFDVYHTSATTTSYTVAGDIKLQSKPTWAY